MIAGLNSVLFSIFISSLSLKLQLRVGSTPRPADSAP